MIEKEILNDNSGVTANSSQIALLKKHFPNCFDKNGAFIPHKMEELVGKSELDLSRESYSLNWLGKSYARLLANENPLTLLKEDKEHNAKPENAQSENLLIKGDNLEVLKHLKNAYSEKIKMIYIDPPYNTGSDGFVYNDDRKFSPEQLSKLAGIETDEAKRILEFTQSKANSHSAWLTFMYPRLYIARELMRDDGVIFISIDDNEMAQLKMLCDEVFGEENFFTQIVVQSNKRGQTYKQIAKTHEHLLIYTKGAEVEIKELPKDKENNDLNLKDEISAYNLRELRNRNPKFGKHNRPNLYYPFYVSSEKQVDGFYGLSTKKSEKYNIEVFPFNSEGKESCWRWESKTADKEINEVLLKSNLVAKKKKDGNFNIYEKYRGTTYKAKSIWVDNDVITEQGTVELGKLGLKGIFDFPKPIGLIQKVLKLGSDKNEIVLDFFAGSGTTAHAVMKLNAEDGGNRRCISVQLPEPTDENSEAYKLGYRTIFDITKARIEKATEKIKVENPDYEGDLGFKIFKTTPIFEGYLDEIEELEASTTLFDGSTLNDDEIETLLTTWKVYDGIPLTQALQSVSFGDYTAHYHDKTIYFMEKGFDIEVLKAFIEKIDTDEAFKPSKMVLFGYNFSSKHQRESKEALKSYTNKKSIELDVIVRY